MSKRKVEEQGFKTLKKYRRSSLGDEIRSPENLQPRICAGGNHCLKLKDPQHSKEFIHLKPRTIDEAIRQCECSKNPVLTISFI
jgi:hypothetical protein